MYRKSLSSGLIIGLLLTPTVAFFVIREQVVRVLPGWGGFDFSWLPPEVLRNFSLAASSFILLFVGTLAAMRVRPNCAGDGFKVGALSGVMAGAVLYCLLLSPLPVLRLVVPFYRSIQSVDQLTHNTVWPLIWTTWRQSLLGALIVPLVGLLLGGVEGLIYTLIRQVARGEPRTEPEPALLNQLNANRRECGKDRQETALRAGLMGGLLVGGILAAGLTIFTAFMGIIAQQERDPTQVVLPANLPRFLPALGIALACLAPFAIVLWGGGGVLLLKNPFSRFGSRFQASMVAGTYGGAIVTTVFVTTVVNMAMIILPAMSGQEGIPLILPVTADRMHQIVLLLFVSRPVIAFGFVLVSTLTGLLFGLPFVLLSALVWPRRPADRAADLSRQIARQPDATLPELYGLFQRDLQAEEVLLQVVRRGKRSKKEQHMDQALEKHGRPRRAQDPALTALAAAYHTVYQHPERAAEALKEIVQVVGQAPNWRWRAEIGELHRFLEEGMQARNVYHLAAIRPLPEQQTSSLPPVLIQAGEHLSRIVAEVKKAQRTDDANSRTIYLNRALEGIDEASNFVQDKMRVIKDPSRVLAYPERHVLQVLLPRWRTILQDAMRDVRGRAILRAEFKTHQAAYMPRLSLYLSVSNEGLNVAERVRVTLAPGQDYQVTAASEARLEILSPGETQEVELALEPRNPHHMRVVVQLLYNDAVEENRELKLADEITFIQAERPFQRIFPIPYITGTPLKTKEMFFGRQDVFAYVREHLLGAYQNNIIILHGQRRTGKTSVLYQLPQVMNETHYGVLLDIQGIASRSEADFFYTLSDEISYSLDRDGIEVTVPPREEYEAQPEFTFRNRFLRGLYPALKEKHLLLMFDEFEELQRHVEAGHISPNLFLFLRNLMQHEQQVDFIFSGTHKLEDLAAEYWSILFNIATYKQITFLDTKEVERLATEPVASFGLEYDPLAVAHIYEVTAGHPFLTQLVCHELVAYHNETERSYLTVADVDAVLERIAERGEAHFKYIWAEADAPERAALLSLAELLAHSDGADAAEVAALIGRHRQCCDLGTDEVLRALCRLESRDILARTALGSERFRFRVDLVRRWVVKNPQLVDAIG